MTKELPIEQAIKLLQMVSAYQQAEQIKNQIDQIVSRNQKQLLDVTNFTDIPIEKGVNIKIEEWDGEGGVEVEWEE